MKVQVGLLLLIQAIRFAHGDDHHCSSSTKTYTAKVNLHAGELGYYTFEECGDVINPTITMEIGETYTFVQGDRTNYMHPLGFAYYPDGAHADVNELEPGITETVDNSCAGSLTCSAPMYYIGEQYLGTYNNNIDSNNNTTTSSTPATSTVDVQSVVEIIGTDNFGLDDYEPLFFRPVAEWSEFDTFNVKLNFRDTEYEKDIFYFCHIHQYMTGRIKLTKNGVVVNEIDDPPIEYEYDQPGTFDEQCGTYALDAFELPNKHCPDKFVCTTEDASTELKQFSSCIDAMNCHMLSGMTTNIGSQSDVALFIHQMIPHHQNAVNMAKALLATKSLDCADLTDDENPDCIMEGIMYEIINSQNHQIQLMQGVLETMGYPETDNCDVEINNNNAVAGSDESKSAAESLSSYATLFSTLMILAWWRV